MQVINNQFEKLCNRKIRAQVDEHYNTGLTGHYENTEEAPNPAPNPDSGQGRLPVRNAI